LLSPALIQDRKCLLQRAHSTPTTYLHAHIQNPLSCLSSPALLTKPSPVAIQTKANQPFKSEKTLNPPSHIQLDLFCYSAILQSTKHLSLRHTAVLLKHKPTNQPTARPTGRPTDVASKSGGPRTRETRTLSFLVSLIPLPPYQNKKTKNRRGKQGSVTWTC